MKNVYMILLIFTFAIISANAQCDNLLRGKNIYSTNISHSGLGNLLTDGNDNTSWTISYGGSITIDLENEDVSSISIIWQGYFMKAGMPSNTTCEVLISDDNITYTKVKDFMAGSSINTYVVYEGTCKRFIKFKNIQNNKPSELGYIFVLCDILVFKDGGNDFTLTQEGHYYEDGDSVKLKVNLPDKYLGKNINYKWSTSNLNQSEIFVYAPGNYNVIINMAEFYCKENPTIIVNKEITDIKNSDVEIQFIIKSYYDYMGNKIIDIDNYKGLYLKIESNNKSTITTKFYK